MRIDIVVRLCVVFLDVLEVSRLFEAGDIPIQISQPVVQDGVFSPYHAQVAFEMLDIDGVEANDCCVSSYVELCELGSKYEGATILCCDLFESVQCSEDGKDVLVVCGLIFCEASFVNSRIEVTIDPFRVGIDLRLNLRRIIRTRNRYIPRRYVN